MNQPEAELTASPSPAAQTCAPAISALQDVLAQLEIVLADLTDEQYRAAPVGVFSSSIGGHLRHCLDHAGALLGAIDSGFLDYDQRERGTPVENERGAALERLRHLQRAVQRVAERPLSQALEARLVVSADGQAVHVKTTLGREAVFVLSHTIHHNALIAGLLKSLGRPTPERFGHAPATLAYQSQCVRSPSSA